MRPEGDAEEIVHRTVRRVYDVLADDGRLRELTDKPPDRRGDFFDSLRKNYPVRREFYNTALDVRDCPESVRDTLIGLGFQAAGSC